MKKSSLGIVPRTCGWGTDVGGTDSVGADVVELGAGISLDAEKSGSSLVIGLRDWNRAGGAVVNKLNNEPEAAANDVVFEIRRIG